MALHTTTSTGLSAEMKTFYDRMLLERTVPLLLHSKFGQQKPIPAHGGRIIEWRKFAALSTATTPLVEGTLYSDLKDLTVTTLTGTVDQYGDAIGFSDLVSTVAFDPILAEATKILAEQAAQTIDELVRDVVVAGTTVEYANEATGRTDIVANDNFKAMDGAGSTATGGSLADLRLIQLQMKLNRARPINGFYQCITHPRVMHDIRSTTEWQQAQLYNQTNRIFDGSVGELYGLKFWETDVAKVYENAGSGSTVDVYTMLVFGQDAFGIVKLSGHNLQTIFKPLGSAGTADPLNQQSTMGWKVTFGTKILQQLFMLRYEVATSTGANT
jgi:N4-gp56 family major capsid protein